MEPNYQKDGGRRLRSREEIIRLLEEYESSEGITVKEYCSMIGVSDAAFYGWRKLYGPKSDAEEKQAEFFELVPSSESTPPVQTLFAEVKGIKL